MLQAVPGLMNRGGVFVADFVHAGRARGGRLLATAIQTAHRIAELLSQLFLETIPRLLQQTREHVNVLIGRRQELIGRQPDVPAAREEVPEVLPQEVNPADAREPVDVEAAEEEQIPLELEVPPQEVNPADAHEPIIEIPRQVFEDTVERPLRLVGGDMMRFQILQEQLRQHRLGQPRAVHFEIDQSILRGLQQRFGGGLFDLFFGRDIDLQQEEPISRPVLPPPLMRGRLYPDQGRQLGGNPVARENLRAQTLEAAQRRREETLD